MLHLTPLQWTLAIIAAFGVGLSKSGLAGIGLLHVLIFAHLFGARPSTGVVLPMLICADLLAVYTFRHHSRWDFVRRLLPATAVGVVIGAWLIYQIGDANYQPLIGTIILALSSFQLLRILKPTLLENLPHSTWFATSIGLLAGITTMLANAAGPIATLYLLAVSIPKLQFAGTCACLFLIINCFKVPFSVSLDLIHLDTLTLNAILFPAIALGLFSGRWIVQRIPQRTFDTLLLALTFLAALHLTGLF